MTTFRYSSLHLEVSRVYINNFIVLRKIECQKKSILKKLATSGEQPGLESFKNAPDLTGSFKVTMDLKPLAPPASKNTNPISGVAAMMPSSTEKESKS